MSTTLNHRGARVALGLTCFVIVVAGLKAASELVLPTMIALFLSLLCVPPMRRLERLGMPSPVALTLVVCLVAALVFLVLTVIGQSIAQFQSKLPEYQQGIDNLITHAILWLEHRGIQVEPRTITDQVHSGTILRLVGDFASALIGVLSNTLLVLLIMIFMLLEANTLPRKLRAAMGRPDADLSAFSSATVRVQEYLAIKAIVSLATGALVGAWCAVCGVDFPLLWGLIAFLFNFVPNIGSIIAAIPPMMLAMLQFGIARATMVGLGYLAVNMVIGNFVEPRRLGRQLGLSTLVVFLSMLFWGWIWGPVGMLLSVPLTVVVKILCEHSDDLRWLAVLLGPGDQSEVHAGGSAGGK